MPFKPAYEVMQVTTAIALAEAGLGVAVLPAYALAASRHRKVAGRPLREPVITREISLIHATGRSQPPAVSAFAAILRRYARQLAPRQTG